MTDTTVLSDAMTAYYERLLLERLKPNLIHCMWGIPGRIARGEGLQIIWRDYGALALATTPLTEGVTPAGSDMSVTKLTATAQQFGDFLKLTDLVQTQTVDPVVEEGVELLGEQAGQTIDTVARDVLVAGTNVRYAGGAANRAAVAGSNKLTSGEASKARLTLENAKVPTFNGYYHSYIHPNTAEDLRMDSRWVAAQGTQNPELIKSGMLGELDGVRYFKSPNAKKFAGAGASGVDVYASLFFGRGAYGVVSYEDPTVGGIDPVFGAPDQYKLPVSIIIQQLGSGGTSDPLRQRATLGWKIAYITKRLRESALCRVEHATTGTA